MIKFVIVCLCLCLVGCGQSQQLSNLSLDKNSYLNPFNSASITFNDSGYYIIQDGELFYKDYSSDSAISLGYVNYVDGERANSSEGIKGNVVFSQSGGDIVSYGDRIYLFYSVSKNDGSSYTELCSIDLKGEDFKEEIQFDMQPQNFRIESGKIYVNFIDAVNDKQIINVYDDQFNLAETKEYPLDEGVDKIYYLEESQLYVMDSPYTLYDNGQIKISYRIEYDSTDGRQKMIGIYDNGDIHIEYEDKIILFSNDSYYYVCSCTSPEIYERYFLDGSLDTSIEIDQQIENTGEVMNSFFTNDFSFILKLKDENVAIGCSGKEYFSCDFSEGKCSYLTK